MARCLRCGAKNEWIEPMQKIKVKDEEQARRLSRYDEAIRLLRECTEFAGKEQLPGLDWIDVQIDKDAFAEALTFLAAEPKKGSAE